MAQNTGVNPTTGRPYTTSTITGNAAASGPDYDRIGEQADWDEYKKANKLSFAAKRDDKYNTWRTNKKAKKITPPPSGAKLTDMQK
jgi:hypothetical protein